MSAGVWVALVVSGVLTYLLRFSLLAFAHRARQVPPGVAEALRMIPAAALAALVAPAVLRTRGSVDLLDAKVVAGVLALVVMVWRRQVVLTLVVGVGALVLLRAAGL